MQTGQNNNNYVFKVEKDFSGMRIDAYLSLKVRDLSRSYIQKLIKNGDVLINSSRVNKNASIYENDLVLLENINLASTLPRVIPSEMKLDILYEDEYLLVISKPPGVTVHPAPGNYLNTLAGAVLYYLKSDIGIFPDALRPGIVHRLDKDTSGLIIIAKTRAAHMKMSDLFKSRRIKKAYIALVVGRFKEKEGKISLPLGRSRTDRKKISVSPDTGRHSETLFEIIEAFDRCTLLNVSPLTGRTHQIRVHLSFIGHPVIGDEQYGNTISDAIAKNLGLKRHFLHAARLEFIHPFTGNEININDKLPPDLAEPLKNLRSV